MNRNNTDTRLHDALKYGTDKAALQKERVWRSISARVAQMDKERELFEMKRKRNHMLAGALAASAVILAAVFFSLTPQGTALADRIIKFFAPEKKIATQLEGATETQNATLQGNTSGESGYVLYIDTERYYKESRDGVDTYKALNAPEGFPPVQMEISQLPNKTPKQAYEESLAQSTSQYDTVNNRGQVQEPVRGWSFSAYDRGGGEKPYEMDYFVDNQAGGCFAIRCKLFVEAEEGHGARFDAMLKTFEVVKSSQVVTSSPSPSASATIRPTPQKLTWDTLKLGGAKLGDPEQVAIDEILKFVCRVGGEEHPESDEETTDAGGKTRTITWGDGTISVFRNGKLYSLETSNQYAEMPNGLHAQMEYNQFVAVLGEPHEAIGGVAWGVGSNDNLIVTVDEGFVETIKISLIE